MSDGRGRHTGRARLLHLLQVLPSLVGAEEKSVHRHDFFRGFHVCVYALSDFTEDSSVDIGGLDDRNGTPEHREFSSKPVTYPFHCQFARPVRRSGRQDDEGGDRGEVDNAAFGGAQGGEETLSQVEGAMDVDIEHAPKRGKGVEFKGEFLRDPGVVHQANERGLSGGKLGKDLFGAGFDCGGDGHVHDYGSKVLETKGFEGSGIGGFTHGAVDDVTLLGQVLRGVVPDPSAGASNDNGPAFGRDGEAFAKGKEDNLIKEKDKDYGGEHTHAYALEELWRQRFWCHGWRPVCVFGEERRCLSGKEGVDQGSAGSVTWMEDGKEGNKAKQPPVCVQYGCFECGKCCV
eukprot:evm.model.NODE_8309_length_5728_cov_33.651711.2